MRSHRQYGSTVTVSEATEFRERPVFMPWIACIYTIIVCVYILDWNRELGYPLPETLDVGRWRGECADFGGFCLLFGVALYPIALYGAFSFVWQAVVRRAIWKKVISLLLACIMLAAVLKFMLIGLSFDYLAQHVL